MNRDAIEKQIPVRIEDLIAAGDNYQVAAGYHEGLDDEVVLRAISYGDDPDGSEVAFRRACLKRQWTFLQSIDEQPAAPDPVEWIEVDDSPVGDPPEPVLVTERIDGPNLHEWIETRHPEGMEPGDAIALLKPIVDLLCAAHAAGWLWRDFDPRRIAVVAGERPVLRSIGGVLSQIEGPSSVPSHINHDYTAPEIRNEVGEKYRRPAADLYGFGALVSFVLSAEEPRHRVESPLSYTAYERIEQRNVAGMKLLVARLLQPMAKGRVQRTEELADLWALDELPTRESPGFEECELPAPWVGLDIDDPERNRGLRSQLSSGPLVSLPAGEEPEGERRRIKWPVVIGLIIAVVAAASIAVFAGGY